MEKILSNSERIRRAEEIYARRRGMEIEEKEEKNNNRIYKTLFRILILINIIICVLSIQNKDYIFREEFLKQFSVYTNIINKNVNSFIVKIKENDENKKEKNEVKETTGIKVVENKAQSTNTEQIVEKAEVLEEVKEETTIEKIKKSYSFVKPIEGTVTSFFGDRQSQYQNVSGFHKGIDIGAPIGTKIKSSIEGTVSLVSSKGDYR